MVVSGALPPPASPLPNLHSLERLLINSALALGLKCHDLRSDKEQAKQMNKTQILKSGTFYTYIYLVLMTR